MTVSPLNPVDGVSTKQREAESAFAESRTQYCAELETLARM
jgi:hypothetical protein